MIASLILGASMAAFVAWLFATAPEGYEDERGFRYGPTPAPHGSETRASGADETTFHSSNVSVEARHDHA